MRRIRSAAGLALAGALLTGAALAPTAGAATTTLMSTPDAALSADPPYGDGNSLQGAISANGRYVVFQSLAANLTSGDTNGQRDIYRRDTLSGATTLISVDSSEAPIPATPASVTQHPAISADGRYVAFQTNAPLATADTDTLQDVYLRDTVAGTTTLLSGSAAATGDAVRPSISADGNRVAFASNIADLVPGDGNGAYDVFVRDVAGATTTRVSVNTAGDEATGNSEHASISADGEHVAFQSAAANLVAGDGNGVADTFVRDLDTPLTERVSVSSEEVEGGAASSTEASGPLAQLSADGELVVFKSAAINLVADDTNAKIDVFLRDRAAGTTERLSVSSAGVQGDDTSAGPAIGADGERVVFSSASTNLVGGDLNGRADIFERDLAADTTTRISLADGGAEGDNLTALPQITPDGRYVSYETTATNLAGFTTANRQVLRFDRGPGEQPEPPVEFVAGEIDWGVKASFRSYIAGPIAHGDITPSEGATVNGDGTFAFPIEDGGFDPASGRATVEAAGKVQFRGHETPAGSGDHLLLLTVSNPRVTIDGDLSVLHADVSSKSLASGEVVDYPDVALALLDASAAIPAVDGAETSWSALPATLTSYGVPAFASFYPAGTALDGVAVTALDELPEGPGDPDLPPPTPPEKKPDPEAPQPEPKAPLVKGLAKPQRIGRNGGVDVAKLTCRSTACKVKAPKRARVKISGKLFRAKVLAPKSLRAGASGRVRIKLPRAAIERLVGRRAVVKLRLVVEANGKRTAKTVRVEIRGGRKAKS